MCLLTASFTHKDILRHCHNGYQNLHQHAVVLGKILKTAFQWKLRRNFFWQLKLRSYVLPGKCCPPVHHPSLSVFSNWYYLASSTITPLLFPRNNGSIRCKCRCSVSCSAKCCCAGVHCTGWIHPRPDHHLTYHWSNCRIQPLFWN